MTSIRAVLCGLLAAAVCAPQAAAEVNIIYPPKRETAHHERAPVEQKRTKINQVVTIVVVQNRDRFSRRELLKHELFRTWTGFIDVYSGPRYPDEWQAPRYPF